MQNTKTLLVYYSRAGIVFQGRPPKEIGNTKVLANYIKSLISVDEVEIQPKEPYPDDYVKLSERALREFKNNERPELLNSTFPELNHYNRIILGYPIWNDTCPMVVNTFLEHYKEEEWKNKNIDVFVTQEGSNITNSIKDLKAKLKGAIIKEGISINGYKVGRSEGLVRNWLKEIGLLSD